MTGLSNIDERVLDEALAWQQALERDDADWDAYTVWLEADPRHRQVFDEVALTDRIVSERAGDLAHLQSIEPPVTVPLPIGKTTRRYDRTRNNYANHACFTLARVMLSDV